MPICPILSLNENVYTGYYDIKNLFNLLDWSRKKLTKYHCFTAGGKTKKRSEVPFKYTASCNTMLYYSRQRSIFGKIQVYATCISWRKSLPYGTLKLVHTYINYHVPRTCTNAIFLSNDHSLCTYYLGWMSCLILFVWAQSTARSTWKAINKTKRNILVQWARIFIFFSPSTLLSQVDWTESI